MLNFAALRDAVLKLFTKTPGGGADIHPSSVRELKKLKKRDYLVSCGTKCWLFSVYNASDQSCPSILPPDDAATFCLLETPLVSLFAAR